ncbi:hypothetical protein JSQ73_006245 [Wolbachia endosymbiont of Anopheles demeilloni]|uniref:hypothetical protein n=1 Tax=Wolbachia endosymbiont of Anopheles demeilloni TaxID=2748871 RepID=UPI001F1A594C|nr:hypothetical protein [Wolbachia endosymbiont of Anopheles demeilloni]UIP92723.1 hypothetical protein JSQ73_006245 [Wolbachia endosymbiont of Anopheles demeilloni]
MTKLKDTSNIDKQPDNNDKPLQKTKQVSEQKGMGAQDSKKEEGFLVRFLKKIFKKLLVR